MCPLDGGAPLPAGEEREALCGYVHGEITDVYKATDGSRLARIHLRVINTFFSISMCSHNQGACPVHPLGCCMRPFLACVNNLIPLNDATAVLFLSKDIKCEPFLGADTPRAYRATWARATRQARRVDPAARARMVIASQSWLKDTRAWGTGRGR